MPSLANQRLVPLASTPGRPTRDDVTRRPYYAKLKIKLRDAGLRPTRQRLVLAAFLFDGGERHLTAEMLYEQASAADARLSLATIYNTLSGFSRAGLLREVAVYGSRTWYDTNTGQHCHFYVEETGELFDIPPNCFSVCAPKMIPRGYKMLGVDFLVRVRAYAAAETPS